MIAAMVNPRNPEGGREFIQILNTSDATTSFEGWQIVAPNRTRFELSDVTVEPGGVFKFTLPGPNGALRNRTGRIQLVDPDGAIQQAVSYSTEEARREGSPIVF